MKSDKLKKLHPGVVILCVFALILVYTYFQIPNVEELRGCLTTKMYSVHLCPGHKNYVRLSQISKVTRAAVIMSEDARFYTHEGFDFEEIQESIKKNVDKGFYARGGSTITQQLAKNVFLTGEKSLLRKLIEARLTQLIEKQYSKDQILEKYLNVVQFGAHIFGIKSAANYYFKKSPAELSILESSFLAMLLPNPIKYSVSFRKKSLTRFARTRIKDLVFRMLKTNKITKSEYDHSVSNLDQFPWDGSVDSPSTQLVEESDSENLEEEADSGFEEVSP